MFVDYITKCFKTELLNEISMKAKVKSEENYNSSEQYCDLNCNHFVFCVQNK